MRKFMSIILALAMILSMSMTAFAAEANTANTYPTVIMDNEDVRIVQAFDGNTRYVSTFDKANNTITTERYAANGCLEASAIVNIDDETIYDTTTNTQIETRAVVASKKTESVYAYEYTNDNPKEWKLTHAKYAGESNDAGYYFKTKQTSINADHLDEFRVTVDSLASKESELKTLVGVSAFLGGFATGFTIGTGGAGFGVALAAYLSAAGFGVAAQEKANQIGELQSTALARYTDVKNESSIYF